MVFLDLGINEIQKKSIRNEGGSVPDNAFFAGSDNTFTGTEESVVNEFLRKEVIWTQTGLNSKYIVEISSVELTGSYIAAFGLAAGEDIGSDIYFTLNDSFIGEKNNTFNVEIEGEIIIRRPTI